MTNDSMNNWHATINLENVQGLHNVTFFCNETAGSTNHTTQYFSLDTQAPTILIESPANQTYNSSSIWANLTLNEAGYCNVSLDGGANTSMTNTGNNYSMQFFGLTDGQHNVTFSCKDILNHSNASAVWFSIDAPPNITIVSPQNQSLNTSAVWMNVTSFPVRLSRPTKRATDRWLPRGAP